MRLDNFLLRTFKNVPKSKVYRIIRSGEVRINRGRAKPATRLAEADEIRLPPVRQKQKPGPGRPPDQLIERVDNALMLEREDLLAFNKPAGLAVHAGSGLRFGLIEVLRVARAGEYVELVHRLDRQTSGCLLVARSRAALDGLRAGLNDAAASKRYLALVDGHWKHGAIEVDAPLSRDVERSGERMVTVDREAGKASVSRFEPLAYYADATLMAVEIKTGRTHQIRVHAAHCGHPVAADDKYGSNSRAARWRERGLNRMFLHAARLQIRYADQTLDLEAPLAPDLQPILDSLDTVQ
jgi:23S rRNA pseudouridine955/2504/2580 synthase